MYNDAVFFHHLAQIASAFARGLIMRLVKGLKMWGGETRRYVHSHEWHHLLRSKLGNQARWKEDQASIT